MIEQAIISHIAANGITLPGGFHTGLEITRQTHKDCFDQNGELLPCALVKLDDTTPQGPYIHSASAIAAIYYYERPEANQIGPVMGQVYTLLHDTRLPGLDGLWRVTCAYDRRNFEDNTLKCRLGLQRYQLIINRQILEV
jgi:hypothetical protein